MQKAYRLLMKIHGECSCVISGIDSAGQLEREIEELNDQVRLFHAVSFTFKISKSNIIKDLLIFLLKQSR